MIAAVIVLSLMSLLVATDFEHTETSTLPTPEPPGRPGRKAVDPKVEEPDRLAA
jgi:hypothetical protein